MMIRLNLILLLLITALAAPPAALAEDGFDEFDEPDASTGPGSHVPRFPRPVSTIADNTTVLTSGEIERLNAHTLAELLQTVNGFQLLQVQAPGSRSAFSLSGAMSLHILVLLDHVPQNLIGGEVSADLGAIPANRIERIEIIKGAASTQWGPALGGVINIITKSPATRQIGGQGFFSTGEHSISDSGMELAGSNNRFGYYLSGGTLNSSGLVSGNRADLQHAYTKLTYALPAKGDVMLALDYRDITRNFSSNLLAPGILDNQSEGAQYLTAATAGNYPVSNHLSLEWNGSFGNRVYHQLRAISTPAPPVLFAPRVRDDFRTADVRLNWHDDTTQLTAGIAYQHDALADTEPFLRFNFLNFTKRLDRLAGYLNASHTVGRFTLLPGIRIDNTNAASPKTSYHLGGVIKLSDTTLLRTYAARGYSLPFANFNNSSQDIWTVQVGCETGAIPYIWLKGNLYYSNTWNIETPQVPPNYPLAPITVKKSEHDIRGFELEAQSISMFHTYLKLGYNYADARDTATDQRVNYIPTHSGKLAVHHDNPGLGLRGALTANYVQWPSTTGTRVTDETVIWDLYLSQRLALGKTVTPEVFFSLHNIFNGAQYVDHYMKNSPRWIEGGVRLRF